MTKIKKRLTAFLTAAACLTGSVSAMTASAWGFGYSLDAAWGITIETDTFTYSNFTLTADGVDANFLVVGVVQSDDPSNPCYTCCVKEMDSSGKFSRACGYMAHEDLVVQMDGTPLQIGDLLKAEDYADWEASIQWYGPEIDHRTGEVWGNFTVTKVGNGVEILGEEFKRVIRLQAVDAMSRITDPEVCYKEAKYIGILDFYGDVNVDDAVDILDCITVNKQLLGSEQISDYVRIFGDVNGDGVLDSTDSLMILKEVVGLTENFEEV